MEIGEKYKDMIEVKEVVKNLEPPKNLAIRDKLKVAFRVFGPNQTLQTGGIMAKGDAFIPPVPLISPYSLCIELDL